MAGVSSDCRQGARAQAWFRLASAVTGLRLAWAGYAWLGLGVAGHALVAPSLVGCHTRPVAGARLIGVVLGRKKVVDGLGWPMTGRRRVGLVSGSSSEGKERKEWREKVFYFFEFQIFKT